MLQGLYIAATGMRAEEGRQSVIANNIANASTPGFRRQQPVQRGFYGVLMGKMGGSATGLSVQKSPGGGAQFIETYTDTALGPLTTTGDDMNIGLDGPGFLSVRTPEGDFYTRFGKLAVNGAGQLTTDEGYLVLGQGGDAVTVPPGTIKIDTTGRVLVDGQAVGQVGLTEFEDPHMLTRIGETLYSASDAAKARSGPAEKTRVAGGALEMANVQIPREMIQMTMGLRAYEANQRVINAFDETMSSLIQQVGTPL